MYTDINIPTHNSHSFQVLDNSLKQNMHDDYSEYRHHNWPWAKLIINQKIISLKNTGTFLQHWPEIGVINLKTNMDHKFHNTITN